MTKQVSRKERTDAPWLNWTRPGYCIVCNQRADTVFAVVGYHFFYALLCDPCSRKVENQK